MKRRFLALMTIALAGCAHDAKDDPCINCAAPTRTDIAADTCDAQAAPNQLEYLSAIQDLIAKSGGESGAIWGASRASLDAFREEVNASYRTVVMRCKTHMECLAANDFEEASCYMSAVDRRDAERDFRDLAYDLRDLEREVQLATIDAQKSKARSARPAPSVTVETNIEQKQDVQVGDDVEDKDVLIAECGVDRLLEKDCRQPCRDRRCRP